VSNRCSLTELRRIRLRAAQGEVIFPTSASKRTEAVADDLIMVAMVALAFVNDEASHDDLCRVLEAFES